MPASLTPEGFPSECAACGAQVVVEYSAAGADAPCPVCGALLIQSSQLADRLRRTIATTLGVPAEDLTNDRALGRVGLDSLETLEVVMAIEEAIDGFRFDLQDEELHQIESVKDLVRIVLRKAEVT